MPYEITTPTGVTIEVKAENDAYLQGLKERGYKVKPKLTIHRKPFESSCLACEG